MDLFLVGSAVESGEGGGTGGGVSGLVDNEVPRGGGKRGEEDRETGESGVLLVAERGVERALLGLFARAHGPGEIGGRRDRGRDQRRRGGCQRRRRKGKAERERERRCRDTRVVLERRVRAVGEESGREGQRGEAYCEVQRSAAVVSGGQIHVHGGQQREEGCCGDGVWAKAGQQQRGGTGGGVRG